MAATSQATLRVEVTVKASGGKIYDVATLAKLLGSVIEAGLDVEAEEGLFISDYDALTIGVAEEGTERTA